MSAGTWGLNEQGEQIAELLPLGLNWNILGRCGGATSTFVWWVVCHLANLALQ